MDFPKVLVLSIDCWNSFTGSDTFTNLLSGYDSDKVANIYFKSGIPDSNVCEKYFYISENAVIKSCLNKNIKTGKTVERISTESEKQEIASDKRIEKKRYSFFTRHRLWMFLYARELLWKAGKWKTEELDSFIESFSPDVIFFPIESYIYFDRVVDYIIDKTKVPAVGIMWDDNFTYKSQPGNIGFLTYRFFLRKRVKRIINKCEKVYAIIPKLQEELQREYNINADILTKGANIDTAEKSDGTTASKDVISIVYTGKLSYGRLGSVQLLADVLDSVNSDDIKYELNIYSGTELTPKERLNLEKKGTYFRGSVPQSEIADIQENADILLFAEAIAGKHKYDARLSFSTKIVDYLARGKCVLAIGPQDIAPIEYLKKEDAAIVVSTKDELKSFLQTENFRQTVEEYSNKAYDLAKRNHNYKDIQSQLYNDLRKAASKKNRT